MSKVKAFFVTALVAAMLALILIGAYKLYSQVFQALILGLAASGYICGANLFRRWLEKETPMLPAKAQAAEVWEPDVSWTGDYDEIRREVESEGAK